LQRNQEPFTASTTATFPGHHFAFTPIDEPDNVLEDIIIAEYPHNLYWYDPYTVSTAGDESEVDVEATERNLAGLSAYERQLYDGWMKTLDFHEQYQAFTGRSYVAQYLRKRPIHFMWRADYIGQEHWVTTAETHFTSVPDADSPELDSITDTGKKRVLEQDQPRLLSSYRDPGQDGVMNMTMTVMSCAPRVFEIKSFLSEVEVDHIIRVAKKMNLKLSQVTGSGDEEDGDAAKLGTRTSYNTWVSREHDAVFDAIYRRAADLMRIDEALFRRRDNDEFPHVPTNDKLVEELQLVHYDPGQQYDAVRCQEF
jgi:hypothetical protein